MLFPFPSGMTGLEGELEVFRHLGTLRDGSSASPDMNRLSTNVTGLTKRLKEQVQQLVDRDTYRSSNSDLHLSNPADRRTYTARTDVRPATVSPSRATSRPYYGDLFEEVGAASRKKYTSADVRSGAAAPANGAAEQYQRSPARGVSSPDMSARGSPSIGRRASPSVGSNGRKY